MAFRSPRENTPTTLQESSEATSPRERTRQRTEKRKPRRIRHLLHRLGSECNLFFVKLKQASQLADVESEVLDSLFESSDDDFFDRTSRSKGGLRLSPVDVQFMSDYKKCSSLDQYHDAMKHSQVPDKSVEKAARCDQVNGNGHASAGSASNTNGTYEEYEMHGTYETKDTHYTHDKNGVSPSNGTSITPYKNLEMTAVREKLEGENSESSEAAGLRRQLISEQWRAKHIVKGEEERNLGTLLWDVRRARWLTSDCGDKAAAKVEERALSSPIKQLPQELFPKIYSDFVDKGRHLRHGKRINLEDMVAVVNAGWEHQKVWEAASRRP